MIKLDSDIKILTGRCAVSQEAARAIFPQIIQYMKTCPDATAEWETLLEQLEAERLIRCWRKKRAKAQPARMSFSSLTFTDSHVLWQGEQIGRVQTFYKATLPHETQARIAYEIFFDRFAAFLTRQYQIVILTQSDAHLELFFPVGATTDMAEIWQTFVSYMFSEQILQENFVNLVNTIEMAKSGFSALGIPIVSEEQAIYLSAFYLANLNSLIQGDKKREKQIAELEGKLITAEGTEAKRLQKGIIKVQKELDTRRKRYVPFYDQADLLRETYPVKMKRVERIVHKQFRWQAGTQIMKRGDVIRKCMSDMVDMLAMEDTDFYKISLSVTSTPSNNHVRSGGDAHGQFCYACGQHMKRGKVNFKSTKFIFEKPRQRPQSGSSEKSLKICGTCAAISFVSPIKIGSDRLIVRMRLQNDLLNPSKEQRHFPYQVNDQLRMLTMGELNIIAGKYVIMKVSEAKRGKKSVFTKLGGEQYALYKIGVSFPAQVFREFAIEAMIGNVSVTLDGLHLSIIQRLNQVFGFAEKLQRTKRQRQMTKGQFAAFGRAIRHVQQDNLIFAIYELATSGILSISMGWPLEKSVALENLRKEHVEWLIKMSKPDIAQQYRDIAAMTALVYPFCAEVSKGLRGNASKQRIEIRKIIDRADDPYELMYTIAPQITGKTDSEYNFRSVRVYLNRNADTYFSYDQLIALFDEIPTQPDKRESQYENSIPLTLDDLGNVYTYLYATRYAADKERREFAYKLKLSLAARFAQHYEPKSSNKE